MSLSRYSVEEVNQALTTLAQLTIYHPDGGLNRLITGAVNALNRTLDREGARDA